MWIRGLPVTIMQPMEPRADPDLAPAQQAQAVQAPALGLPVERAPAGRGWDAAARALYVVALLVALVRFVRLGDWSLWIDEVLTWGDAHGVAGGLKNPVGYWIVRQTVEAVGEGPTEAALRLAPALFGFLCVPLTAWAFAPLAGARRASLAALVVAASAWQVQWAQTARFYTMAEVLSLAGAGLAIRGALRGRPLGWIAGIAVAGAGVLFHPHAAPLAAAMVAAGLLAPLASDPEAARRLRRATALLVGLGLAATPLLWQAWSRYAADKPATGALSGLSHFVLATVSSVTPGVLALALGGLLVGAGGRERGVWFVAAVCLVNVLVLCVLSTRAVVTSQYAFSVFPWVALLAAWPIGSAGVRRVRGLATGWGLAALVPLLAGLFLYMTVEYGQRARWREAVALVEELRDPTDLVAATPAVVAEFYLTGAVETDVRRADAVLQIDRWGAHRLDEWLRSGRDAWIIVRNDYLNQMWDDQRAHVRRLLSEECRLVKSFPVHALGRDLSIDVWRMGSQ